MNLRKEFNRIEHLFHNGVDKTQKASEDWVERQTRQAAGMAQRMREHANVRKIVSTEEAIITHVRENPSLYLIGAALLLGALVAKLIMESREARRAPLL